VRLAALLALAAMPAGAWAQEGGGSDRSETDPDPFANESFRPLILVRDASVEADDERRTAFFETLGLALRYGVMPMAPSSEGQRRWSGESLGMSREALDGVLGGSASSREERRLLSQVRAWCRASTAEMQQTRGEMSTDGSGGAMEGMTASAIRERCSQLLDLELRVEAVNAGTCAQGDTCDVRYSMVVRRYLVSFNDEGEPVWSLDDAFGSRGATTSEATLSMVRPPVPAIGGLLPGVGAELNAYSLAVRGVALAAQRALQEIPQLQTRALVAAVEGGNVRFCGSRQDIVLDTPFYVRYPTDAGVREAGFVVARDLSDGCTLTSSLQERETSTGRAADIRPSLGQMIFGGGSVRPGMTLWQMPSVGLNLVFGVGTTPSYALDLDLGELSIANLFAPAVSVGAEYNFGRYIGVSELYAVLNVQTAVQPWNGRLTISGSGNTLVLESFTLFIRPEIGILKRFFLGGNFFTEAGAYVSQSTYVDLGGLGDTPWGVGGRLEVGLGFQLDPRMQFRIDVGALAGFSQVGLASYLELGPTLSMSLSYGL
jgi:hypothetical protein